MDIISLFQTLILCYISTIGFYLIKKYLSSYNKNKLMRFTQQEVMQRQLLIDRLIIESNLERFDITENSPFPAMEQSDANAIYKILSQYNELAFGINEGLYDESYVKVVMGNDIYDFYKNHRRYVRLFQKKMVDESIFLPLELILSKWYSKTKPSVEQNPEGEKNG